MKTDKRTGGCLCGAVLFECDVIDRNVVACHCDQCRRQSGHYWASVDVDRATLAVAPDAALRWYRSSQNAERGFCGACGAWLFWRGEGDPFVSVSVGALDDPSRLTLTDDIFIASKPDYYELSAKTRHHPRDLGPAPASKTP